MLALNDYIHNNFGGLNSKLPDASVKPWEAEFCTNFYFEGDGITKREGTVRKNKTPIRSSNSKITGLYNYQNSTGSNILMVVSDNGVNAQIRDAQNNIIDDFGGVNFSTGNRFSFVTYNNLAIYCNNIEPIRKYNGINASNLGGTPPSTAKALCVHNNFVLAGNVVVSGVRHENRIYYSALANPESWDLTYPAGDVIPIRLDDGDEIVAIKPYTEQISVVFKNRSIWTIDGFGEPFTVNLIWDGIGAANQWVINTLDTPYGRSMIFLSKEGRIYILPISAFTLTISEKAPIYVSEPIQDILSYHGFEQALTEKLEDFAFAEVSHVRNEWLLAVPSISSTGYCDIVLRYDYMKSRPDLSSFWWSKYTSENKAYSRIHSLARSRDASLPTTEGFDQGATAFFPLGSRTYENFSVTEVGADTESCQFYNGLTDPPGAGSFFLLVQTLTSRSYGMFCDKVKLRLKKGDNSIDTPIFKVFISDITNQKILSRYVTFKPMADLTDEYAWYEFDVRDTISITSPVYIPPNITIGINIAWESGHLGEGHLGEVNLCWKRHSTDKISGGAAHYVDSLNNVALIGGDFVFELFLYRLNMPVQRFSVSETKSLRSVSLELAKLNGGDAIMHVFIFSNTSGCPQGIPNQVLAQTGSIVISRTTSEWYTFKLTQELILSPGTYYWIVPLYIPSYTFSKYVGFSDPSALPSLFNWKINQNAPGHSGNVGMWAGTIGVDPTSHSVWNCQLLGQSLFYKLHFSGPFQMETLLSGDDGGFIYTLNSGTSDEDENGNLKPISCRYDTSWIDYGLPHIFKANRYFYIIAETSGTGLLEVKFYNDFEEVPSDNITFDLNDALRRSRNFPTRIKAHGSFLKVSFLESSKERFKLEKMTIRYQLKRAKSLIGRTDLIFQGGGSPGSGGPGSGGNSPQPLGLYVTETSSSTLGFIDLQTNQRTTKHTFTGAFSSPTDVLMDSNGNLIITLLGQDMVQPKLVRLTPGGSLQTIVTFDDFSNPLGVSEDLDGSYIVCLGGLQGPPFKLPSVVKVTPGGVITTIFNGYSINGPWGPVKAIRYSSNQFIVSEGWDSTTRNRLVLLTTEDDINYVRTVYYEWSNQSIYGTNGLRHFIKDPISPNTYLVCWGISSSAAVFRVFNDSMGNPTHEVVINHTNYGKGIWMDPSNTHFYFSEESIITGASGKIWKVPRTLIDGNTSNPDHAELIFNYLGTEFNEPFGLLVVPGS